MKILIIPDIHGSGIWKELIKEPHDLCVFLGDYTDSLVIDRKEIISNLQDIIIYKKENNERVELLLGNHDIQYAYYPQYRCSGFDNENYGVLQQIFFTERDLFKVAYQPNKEWLFTHAGVSIKWYRKYLDLLTDYSKKLELNLVENLADILNYINNTEHQHVLHEVGTRRGGYANNTGGITWADITELGKGILPYKHQVVGHNHVNGWISFDGPNRATTTCTLIDCLTYENENYDVNDQRNKPFIIEI